jgi:hypothetical protein
MVPVEAAAPELPAEVVAPELEPELVALPVELPPELWPALDELLAGRVGLVWQAAATPARSASARNFEKVKQCRLERIIRLPVRDAQCPPGNKWAKNLHRQGKPRESQFCNELSLVG